MPPVGLCPFPPLGAGFGAGAGWLLAGGGCGGCAYSAGLLYELLLAGWLELDEPLPPPFPLPLPPPLPLFPLEFESE